MATNKELQQQVTALREENAALRKQLSEGGDAGPPHTDVQQLTEELAAARALLQQAEEEAARQQQLFDAAAESWRQRYAGLEAGETPPGHAAEVVVLRRAARVGDRHCEPGERLAVVHLANGVSLNYLVDAVRHDLARGEPSPAK